MPELRGREIAPLVLGCAAVPISLVAVWIHNQVADGQTRAAG